MNVNLIIDDRVQVPKRGSNQVEGAWDGTFGLLDAVKTVTTSKGNKLQGGRLC